MVYPPLGRYEKYPVKDSALLVTAADNFFWTFEQVMAYCKFTIVNYIGFHDRGMLHAGGCGDKNGKPGIGKANHLVEAYEFGKIFIDEWVSGYFYISFRLEGTGDFFSMDGKGLRFFYLVKSDSLQENLCWRHLRLSHTARCVRKRA